MEHGAVVPEEKVTGNGRRHRAAGNAGVGSSGQCKWSKRPWKRVGGVAGILAVIYIYMKRKDDNAFD